MITKYFVILYTQQTILIAVVCGLCGYVGGYFRYKKFRERRRKMLENKTPYSFRGYMNWIIITPYNIVWMSLLMIPTISFILYKLNLFELYVREPTIFEMFGHNVTINHAEVDPFKMTVKLDYTLNNFARLETIDGGYLLVKVHLKDRMRVVMILLMWFMISLVLWLYQDHLPCKCLKKRLFSDCMRPSDVQIIGDGLWKEDCGVITGIVWRRFWSRLDVSDTILFVVSITLVTLYTLTRLYIYNGDWMVDILFAVIFCLGSSIFMHLKNLKGAFVLYTILIILDLLVVYIIPFSLKGQWIFEKYSFLDLKKAILEHNLLHENGAFGEHAVTVNIYKEIFLVFQTHYPWLEDDYFLKRIQGKYTRLVTGASDVFFPTFILSLCKFFDYIKPKSQRHDRKIMSYLSNNIYYISSLIGYITGLITVCIESYFTSKAQPAFPFVVFWPFLFVCIVARINSQFRYLWDLDLEKIPWLH